MKIFNIQKNTLSTIIKFSFIVVITFIMTTSAFAFPCTGKDSNGVPTPYQCDPNEPLNGTTSPGNGTTSPRNGTTSPDNGTTSADGGVKINTGIANPISGVEDIPQLIEAILNFVLIIGVPVVALAIIYSGFLFVTAQGNSEKLTTAKKTLLYTLIGAALLLGCLVITKAIKGTVDCLGTDTVTCK